MLYNTILTYWWWAQHCSKHVEKYNKLIKKRIFALSWSIAKIKLRCTVSNTSKLILKFLVTLYLRFSNKNWKIISQWSICAFYWINYKLNKSFIIFQIVSIWQNWVITTKFCLEISFRPSFLILSSRILRIDTCTVKRLDANYSELKECLTAKKLQRRLNRRGLQITWIILKDSTITGRPKKRWRDQFHLEDQGTGNTPNPSGTWWWW